jgi:uncharacterized protein (TIGR02246 family)
MKRFSVAILAMTGLVTLATAASADESAEDEVVAAYQAWDKAFGTGDAKQVAAFYTEDAVFLPPTHDVMEGPAGVEKFFAGLFAAGVTGHKLELIEAMGEDDDEVVVAAAKWSAKGKDGSGVGGVATHVFEKQDDGSLKLKLHTFN